MNTKTVQEHLKSIGWPLSVDGSYGQRTFDAVWEFQKGFAFRDMLIDGRAGPATWQALTESVQKGGACSLYFKYAEFKSKGDGWIKCNRELYRRLDQLRHHYGPIRVTSGYRDPIHNRKVGGKQNSIHLYGGACDPDFVRATPSLAAVKRLGLFSGIGYSPNGAVRHVDVRGIMAPNTTGGTPANPTTWAYEN